MIAAQLARAGVAALMIVSALAATVAQSRPQNGAPALRFREASGCGGLFVYTWNDDRSEVLTIRADRSEVPLPDGTTTIDLAKAGPGVAVRVEVTKTPRESLPFCSDENAKTTETPTVWTAVAGKVKVMLKRRPGSPFQPVNVSIDDLVLRSADGTEIRQRRDITFTAAIGDFEK